MEPYAYSPSGSPRNNDTSSPGLGSMLVAPSSSTYPTRLSSAEYNLTIPDRPALISRRHSTLSPLRTSRPLRSSPLAGPSIAVPQDDTLNLGALSAPPTPRGGARHLPPLAEVSAVADPRDSDDLTTQKHRRRRSLSAVFSKMSFPSSTSTPTSSASVGSSASLGSSASSVPEQPAEKPRRRLRSLGADEAPPVPPMPAWAHDTMPNRQSQNLSASPSLPSTRSHVFPRPVSGSVHPSPLSSRENLPAGSPRTTHVRRSIIQGQGQGQMDPRASTRLSISSRLPPSTSRNPEENWLTQAAPPKFSRTGLKAQGVVMPISARDARRMSMMSTASARAKSLEVPAPPARARVASNVSHGRVPRRPATAPSLALMPAPSSHLRSRTSSVASASSTRSHSSEYFGDRSGSGCDTPPLTMSSMTSASSVSVSFADPPVTVVGTRADESGIVPPSPASGVQIQLNDMPVPPEAYYSAAYDLKRKGKGRAAAVDVRSVASAGSISSMVSQTSWSAYSARSAVSGNESAAGAEDLSFSPRHARAATAPAEAHAARAHERTDEENLKRRRSTIAKMWKQVMRSVAHR